jgi:hypothetical protein
MCETFAVAFFSGSRETVAREENLQLPICGHAHSSLDGGLTPGRQAGLSSPQERSCSVPIFTHRQHAALVRTGGNANKRGIE